MGSATDQAQLWLLQAADGLRDGVDWRADGADGDVGIDRTGGTGCLCTRIQGHGAVLSEAQAQTCQEAGLDVI